MTSRWREVGDLARALGIAAPPAAVAIWFTLRRPGDWVPLCLALGASVVLALWMQGALARRLRTMASVLAAFREGDFSIRARLARGGALFDDVLQELNQLGNALRSHRLGEMEAWTLLRKVMAEIDVVVLAFDEEGRVRLANDAAARLLGVTSASLVGQQASALGLAELLEGEAPRALRDASSSPSGSRPAFGGTSGRGPGPWQLRRGTFRLSGQLHSLVVLSDVGGALREQERDAWKRLIRVMGHEINNSLAPIQSLSESLQKTLRQAERPSDWEQDLGSGLSVIGRRAEALGRFTGAYAQLARLPHPSPGRVDVAEWVRRAVRLEPRVPVEILGGPDVAVLGDADQLDQLLINLLKNAADATLEARPPGGVRVRWSSTGRALTLVVEDDGPGVADTTNLFVPFFTTKPGGSGIGLVLVRQIAEAHGGDATLRPRAGGSGAEASVRLPVAPAAG